MKKAKQYRQKVVVDQMYKEAERVGALVQRFSEYHYRIIAKTGKSIDVWSTGKCLPSWLNGGSKPMSALAKFVDEAVRQPKWQEPRKLSPEEAAASRERGMTLLKDVLSK